MATVASELANMKTPGGSTATPSNTGKVKEGGVKVAPSAPRGIPRPGGPGSAQVAAAVAPASRPAGAGGAPGGPGGAPPPGSFPGQQARPTIAMPGPAPRPGMQPPYPDARSPNPTLMPNGVPIMPPPSGFLQAGIIPRVPLSITPGARAAGAPQTAPPTMPPVHQSNMPLMANTMQMPHIPPGGAPMPQRPGQTPQVMRRPGMSGMIPPQMPGGSPMPPGGAPAPMGRPPGGIARPVPGGPPVRAPDGQLYIHQPHAGGLYHRVG
jgi:hypothetical protein